jgi:hypothetical protein
MHPLVSLIARIFLSAIFILSGFGKITAYAATEAYMQQHGVPGVLLPAVIAIELLGGVRHSLRHLGAICRACACALFIGRGCALSQQLRRPDADDKFHEERRDGWRLALAVRQWFGPLRSAPGLGVGLLRFHGAA